MMPIAMARKFAPCMANSLNSFSTFPSFPAVLRRPPRMPDTLHGVDRLSPGAAALRIR